ncbi:MAG: MGDG synthase family glycosyltransferase, partial [Candidatus Helarchaeota archaeon]
MNKKHKIIFATIKVGFGHEIPALSVSNALKEMLKDNYEIILMDFMKDIGCSKIDLIHKKIWKYLLNHSLICKIGEKLLDVTWPASKLFIKLLLLPFYKCAFSFLVKNKSDIIFSTHPFNTMIIGDIKRIFKLKFKLINYLTELFDFSCLWIQKNIDYFLVPTIEAKNKAIKKGIPSSKIYIFDFPLRDSFFKIEDNVKYNVFKS